MKIFRLLASNKVAVVLLGVLAVVLAVATFYESIYDASTARRLVYGSWWFYMFLMLLGVNVLLSLVSRFPWKRNQAGFVLAHVGIITLLLGSLATRIWGIDGQLALREGDSGDRITLQQPQLVFGPSQAELQEIPVEFRWNPPREDNPYRYPLTDGVVAVVDRYIHNATEVTEMREDPAGEPAVRIRIGNSQVNASEWLSVSKPSLEMGPARLQFHIAADEAEAERRLAQKSGAQGEAVDLQMPGYSGQIPLEELRRGPVPLGDTGYSARVLQSYARLSVQGKGQLVDRPDGPPNPALQLEISDGKGNSQALLLFALHPDFNMPLANEGSPPSLEATYQAGAEQGGIDLVMVSGSDQIHYRLVSGQTGKLTPGQEVATGWMDLQLKLEQALPRALAITEFQPVDTEGGQELPPAVRITLEGAQNPGPHWLRPGQSLETVSTGGKPLWFSYGMKTVPFGFSLKLLDFEVGTDPGTANPATYKSQVEVEGTTSTIQMNEPLVKNGFTFFQSSYQLINGEPVVSVFSVAKDPGIVFTYLGSILIVAGIGAMIYQRSRAAAATQAKVARKADDARSPDAARRSARAARQGIPAVGQTKLVE
ncbi:MAG: cytochrome c biogenesis protein ResB [Armatimonadetes bacterium]|nr:cytochrome c biogenesis protein ResB [Armatimonadota bacterium]